MASRYDKPHLDISGRYDQANYTAPQLDRSGSAPPRDPAQHGAMLRQQLQSAFEAFDNSRPQQDTLDGIEGLRGAHIEVELSRGTPIDAIEKKREQITPTATKLTPAEDRIVALFVPDGARNNLDEALRKYAEELTEGGKPQQQTFVRPIQAIRQARFETYYTDSPEKLPDNPDEPVWWEVWTPHSAEEVLEQIVERMGLRIAESERRLRFPESTVVPLLASRTEIEHVLFARFTIQEIRRATDTPTVFLDGHEDDAYEWTENLAERVIWPGVDAPAVCILDTGVNRAHDLIEPALSEDDLDAVNPEWGVTDHEPHGTQMSGIALHGDLTDGFQGSEEIILRHRLESVKILPPSSLPATEEKFWGPVTQAAIARPEIRRADRSRVYCMAVSNEEVSGQQPSAWSAAIDQAASGAMIGDDDKPRRLVLLSSGNAPAHIERRRIQSSDAYSLEDPGQAWNALTVGGFTDKVEIDEEGLEDYTPFSAAGDISPFTRTSTLWNNKSPFKPDILMEAGNRAVSPSGNDVLSAESLALLSTGADAVQQPLVPFRATSAATAGAAKLAARLMAEYPDYWPETIRALIVHSAEWTPAMRAEFDRASGMTEQAALLRRFGYGVPVFERASASATNHLALVAQAPIQPFHESKKAFKDCHFYPLPWPKEALEQLGDITVQVKVTLSYFIEPNPGFSSSVEPYRYQSFGLRFDLRRLNESQTAFRKGLNAGLRQKGETVKRPTDGDEWLFGPKSVSAGSLHSDVWQGAAAKLLTRDTICVYPVGGWWKNRAAKDIRSQKTRYALVVSLKSPDADIDLYTRIQSIIDTGVEVEI